MSATSIRVATAVAIFMSGMLSAAQAADKPPAGATAPRPGVLVTPSKPQEGRNPPTRRPQAQSVQPCLDANNPHVACTDKLKAKDRPGAK